MSRRKGKMFVQGHPVGRVKNYRAGAEFKPPASYFNVSTSPVDMTDVWNPHRDFPKTYTYGHLVVAQLFKCLCSSYYSGE